MEYSFKEGAKDFILNDYLAHYPQNIRISHYFELIDFLIEEKIIPPKNVRIYTVINEFKFAMEEKRFKNKTKLVKSISEKLGLHENTIWNIIRDHTDSFKLLEHKY